VKGKLTSPINDVMIRTLRLPDSLPLPCWWADWPAPHRRRQRRAEIAAQLRNGRGLRAPSVSAARPTPIQPG